MVYRFLKQFVTSSPCKEKKKIQPRELVAQLIQNTFDNLKSQLSFLPLCWEE